MKMFAMNMAVKHGYVFVGCERVHHVVAVAREPFPFGLEVKQRPMGEHDDRGALRKAREIRLHPSELRRSDLGPPGRNVVERDEMDAAMIERVVGRPHVLAEHVTAVERGVILARHYLDLSSANF